jgi:hypothetical protein
MKKNIFMKILKQNVSNKTIEQNINTSFSPNKCINCFYYDYKDKTCKLFTIIDKNNIEKKILAVDARKSNTLCGFMGNKYINLLDGNKYMNRFIILFKEFNLSYFLVFTNTSLLTYFLMK